MVLKNNIMRVYCDICTKSETNIAGMNAKYPNILCILITYYMQ